MLVKVDGREYKAVKMSCEDSFLDWAMIDKDNLSVEMPAPSLELEELKAELGEDGWELVGFENGHSWFERRKAPKDGAQSLFEE